MNGKRVEKFVNGSFNLDLHKHIANVSFTKAGQAHTIFVAINGLPFKDEGSQTEAEQKRKILLTARQALEELLNELPVKGHFY
jgi:hypothetical protein